MSAVFNVQLKNLDAISPDACNLLKIVAFFDPETIPLGILALGAQRVRQRLLGGEVSSAVINPTTEKKPSMARRMIAHLPRRKPKSLVLASHHSINCDVAPSLEPKLGPIVELMCSKNGLVEVMNHFEELSLAQSRYGNNPSLHLHDLNQLVLLEQSIVADQAEEHHTIAVTLLTSAFETINDLGSPQSWAECESLVPHLTSLQKHYPAQTSPSREFMNMSQGIAKYFQKRGRYTEAEVMLRKVLAHREAVFGLVVAWFMASEAARGRLFDGVLGGEGRSIFRLYT